MKQFRIRGSLLIINAKCLKDAIKKLVNDEFTYTRHWYTRSNRKSWATFTTPYGYTGIVEEV